MDQEILDMVVILTGAAEIAYFLYCYKKYVKPLDRETA